MARKILAVIVGYVVMTVAVIAFIFGLWAILGFENAFKPGSYEASTSWSVGEMVTGLVAAVIGGAVAGLIGRSAMPIRVLAAIVLVLGFAMAVSEVGRLNADEGRPDGPIAFTEAGQRAYSPMWHIIMMPIVGAVGVMFGGCLVGYKPGGL